MNTKSLHIVNRKAGFEYRTDISFTAGIMLTGTEVKSIRLGNVNINDAYCMMTDGELFIRNLHISEYKQGGFGKHETLRDRKLLLNRHELKKIASRLKEKGTAVYPLKMFTNERGIFKVEIGVGKGKKSYDKREDIKARDIERELSKIKF